MTSARDEDLLAVAYAAARAGAAVLVEHAASGRGRDIQSKSSPTDLVSAADIAAEKAIRAVLERTRPDDGIMGEEGDDVPGFTGLRWIVDPLDGTINYLFGIPQWCVSVACEGRCGVIFDPPHHETYTVTSEPGSARCNGEPLVSSRREDLATALIATGFGYEAHVRERQAAIVERVLPQVRDIRRAGSAALDLAWAAAGRLDGYFEFGVQPWDYAVGELLCRATGLHVEHLPERDGLPAGLLVAAPAIAPALLELVNGFTPDTQGH